MTPAREWNRRKQRYAPSTARQIAGILRDMHDAQRENNEDRVNFLIQFERKQAAFERQRDPVSDRRLLLPFLAVLPESYNVETTQIVASPDLDRSMVERLSEARYRKLSNEGRLD